MAKTQQEIQHGGKEVEVSEGTNWGATNGTAVNPESSQTTHSAG